MTHKRDAPEPTERQRKLSEWFQEAVAEKEAIGWSRSYIARECKLSRKDLYRFLDPYQIPKSPRSETIHNICDGLRLDHSVPARILGWSDSDLPTLTDLEGKIRRAEAYLRALDRQGALTPELKAQYEGRLEGYKKSYSRMLDDFFEEMEAEFSGGSEG